MKRGKKIAGIGCFVMVAIGVMLFGQDAFAAETGGGWRPVFDLVMRWLNFGIIAFILVKFAKTPIKDFLQGRREELAREINKIEEKKEAANKKIQEALQMLNESEQRFAQIKERIIKDGERKKQKIIEEARYESQILLEATKKKLQSQLLDAKKAFHEDLIEMAVALAMERLPAAITPEDDQKFIDLYLAGITSK